MANEQGRLEALSERAGKLGHQIELSMDKRAYCLWETIPGVGRYLILGREGGVALDAIAQKLDQVEAEKGKKAR